MRVLNREDVCKQLSDGLFIRELVKDYLRHADRDIVVQERLSPLASIRVPKIGKGFLRAHACSKIIVNLVVSWSEDGNKRCAQGKEAALTHTNRHTGRASTVLRLGWLRCPADLSEHGSKGRPQGAPSYLKMPLGKERAGEERVSRGQASERAVCAILLR